MDRGDFLERLNFIPSLFTLNIVSIPTAKLKSMRAKLENSDEDEYDMKVNNNLASFLAFLFQDLDECEAKNTLGLQNKPRNIQANVMKAVLYYQMDRITEAEDKFRELKKLSEDDYLMTEAKAEKAYAYSKMGALYYNTAIELYDEVTKRYPDQYDWKHRMALTIRRCQHPTIIALLSIKDPLVNYHRATELFEDIIENSQDSEIRGFSYIGLANLHSGPCAKKVNFKGLGLQPKALLEKTIEYLDKANEEAPQNATILSETGRMLRVMKEFKSAKKVLESAIAMKPTSINCHHLALVLQKLQVENFNQLAIDMLEQSVRLSQGTNLPAIEELGKVYMELSPPNYEQALECFKVLTEDCNYMWRRHGNERAINCYKGLALRPGISSVEKRRYFADSKHCKRESIVNAAMEYLAESSAGQRQKIPLKELFRDYRSGTGPFYNIYSSLDQFKRIVRFFKSGLSFKNDIDRACSSCDVNGAFRALVYNYLESRRYYDCLDLATILMVTDIPDIEKVAVEMMMDIVQQTADQIDQTDLVKTCFKRALDNSYNTEEVDSHVRIIYNTTTSDEEAGFIENCLSKIGLKVANNDEDIFSYQSRNESLLSAMSGNVVVICIFKNNDKHLLDNYPIDVIPQDQPVVIPLVVNSSHVCPMLRHIQPMEFPNLNHDNKPKGTFLKDLGNRLFAK
ncbi:uncharacterized protein LOC126832527 [Patella vulgata]|uniref:uncharacterized protein LOC126832527 n=1 Tax=Patella vulgata TaxID=6465 RepID=UPI0024A838FF|nr:uncharacterized protein LOC126832527 [Patella vulgata]